MDLQPDPPLTRLMTAEPQTEVKAGTNGEEATSDSLQDQPVQGDASTQQPGAIFGRAVQPNQPPRKRQK